MRETEIIAWTEEWGKLFKLEEAILKEILKEEVVDVFHIGSTAIPTIGFAKPIIDILIVVKDIEKVDLFSNEIVKLGYEPKGENGIIGRRYFSKGKAKRTHHIHIFQDGNENIDIHLQFKQYLINNPLEAKQYGNLKVDLAKCFPNDHYKYQLGKQQFLNELVSKAKDWAGQKRDFY